MMIKNLVEDIYGVLKNGAAVPSGAVATSLNNFATTMSSSLLKRITTEDRPYEMGKLYASDVGKPCNREKWYKYRNTPGEKLSSANHVKFMYGDLIEGAVLSLAELAGHKVEMQQHRVELSINSDWKLSGRIDALIDGHLVDVKSVAKQSLYKFKDDLKDDPFGYLMQLSTYSAMVENSGSGFLTLEKQSGSIEYFDYSKLVKGKDDVILYASGVANAISSDTIPDRMDVVPEGTSGNLKIGTNCSYCSYKQTCWADCNEGKGLRTFAYSGGKYVHLVHIEKLPKVDEVTLKVRNGQDSEDD
jgi:hypothetical protein